MAGFEYRYKKDSADQMAPAFEYELDTTYAGTAKPNDVVKLNASGKVIKAVVSEPAANILGVLAAKTIKLASETVTFGKVYTNKDNVYEVAISAGTPAIGGKYEVTADGRVDASKTTAPAVKVEKVLAGGTAYVSFI